MASYTSGGKICPMPPQASHIEEPGDVFTAQVVMVWDFGVLYWINLWTFWNPCSCWPWHGHFSHTTSFHYVQSQPSEWPEAQEEKHIDVLAMFQEHQQAKPNFSQWLTSASFKSNNNFHPEIRSSAPVVKLDLSFGHRHVLLMPLPFADTPHPKQPDPAVKNLSGNECILTTMSHGS